MNKVVSTERIPIKSWCPDAEEGALIQARNAANLPFAFSHVALMPDSHQGYGAMIGGVMAAENVVVPNFVGMDIGCGVCATQTNLKAEEVSIDTLKKIMGDIRKVVPVGFTKHKTPQDENLMPCVLWDDEKYVVDREYSNATLQLGTLGGGNHFIEIQKDTTYGYLWIMIHSGSRNVGKQVADNYNKIAVEANAKWHSGVPKEWDLAFLPTDYEGGIDYLNEMEWCVEYALANRKLMMDRILEIINNYYWGYTYQDPINIAHNYASLEHHFGHDVYVHRKGATLARADTIGLIPGSQGTSSYVVKGKGNPQSFMSCSHGAGRKMGRKEAQRTLNLEDEIAKLDEQGIIHGVRSTADLDEAAGSYKDITTVMKNQEDLVEILYELKPMGVIKG